MANMVKATWEKHAPWWGAVAGCLLAYFAGGVLDISGDFLSTLATMAIVLCALSGVSLSILLTPVALDVLEKLKRANYYGDLIGGVRVTVITSLLSMLAALAGLAYEVATSGVYIYILFGVFMSAIFSFLRMFWFITEAGVMDAEIKMKQRWGDKPD